MKKFYLLVFTLLFFSLFIKAQGVYQFLGTTSSGGRDDVGVIFSTNTAGDNFQERFEFNIANPGAKPLSEPVECNGKFYGTTNQGGKHNVGVIFEWDPATNLYSKKYQFLNGPDGNSPQGSLTLKNGKLYGMTSQGGIHDAGVIFEWDPSGNVYTKKFDLIVGEGSYPTGSLTLDDGKFYGMTLLGGNNDAGVIFEWNPLNNIYTKKIDLDASTGRNPLGSLSMKAGKFYGMTQGGGANDEGVIFEWNPSGNIYTKKIDLQNAGGRYPLGTLMLNNGKFYGMTLQGGVNDEGVIFEWDPAGNIYTKKIDLSNANGYYPHGGLTYSSGKFYGMTSQGGVNNKGVIFEWDPTGNVYTKKIDLGPAKGSEPFGNLILNEGKLYGMAWKGGSNDQGVIFEWNPSNNQFSKKIDLNYSNGNSPFCSLTQNAGKSYGMTYHGGNNNQGIIFEWDAANAIFTKKIDLDNNDGIDPQGGLTLVGGKFYGISRNGGNNNYGVIFEYDPTNNTYSKKLDFNGTNGLGPWGNLIFRGNKFYGTTFTGGTHGAGVIFEYDPATNVYTKKINFNFSIDGTNPVGELAYRGGKFYGMTHYGGSNDAGVIFEWDPATNIYTKKYDLSMNNGIRPYGHLTLKNGKFYATTAQGGNNDLGVIFEWDPTSNVYTKMFDFSSANGSNPYGSLMLNGEKFYGMTYEGGDYNKGVIFEWHPVTNVYTKKKDFQGTDGAYPYMGNDLSITPATVAKGFAGNCTSFPLITIDNSNNNMWVPVVDGLGDVVAEIKANGNNLGVVNSSMYINNATTREDGNKRMYLDRNLTITPTVQPASAVEIRLYLKGSEYQTLKNATNSAGQPSGINSINDVAVFKNNDGCSQTVQNNAHPVTTIAGNWESDYVLTASITSFSSFYFANQAPGGPLPLSSLEFNGRVVSENAELNWKTRDEFNTHSFELERSIDGRTYSKVTSVAAHNQSGIHLYKYTDVNIAALGTPVIYYRLKQKDIDGKFGYSSIVVLSVKNSNAVLLYPNPVTDKANLIISINQPEQVQVRVIDNTGRLVKQQQWNLTAGSNSLLIDVTNLASGVYYLELKGQTVNEHMRFSKQ